MPATQCAWCGHTFTFDQLIVMADHKTLEKYSVGIYPLEAAVCKPCADEMGLRYTEGA